DFGIYGLFEIVFQLLPIVALGIPSALQRWVGLKKYFNIRKSLFFTSFVFLATYTFFLFLILIPLLQNVASLYFENNFINVIYIILVIVYFQNLTRISLVLLRMDERSVFYALSNSLKIALQLVTIIYLITIEKLGFVSIFWGELVGTLFLFLITFPYLFKNFDFKFDFSELKSMIKFGVPTIFSNFSRQIYSFVDRYLLSLFVSKAALGTYVLGFKISSILGTFLVTSFNIALPAIAWPQVGTENQNRFFTKMLTYFSFVLIWASLFLAVFSKGIIHQFAQDKSYWDAYLVVPILVVGFIFSGMFTVLNYGILITKNTNKIPIIVLISLGMNISLNLLLVPRLSFMGTAIAMMTTSISQTVLTYFFSRKEFPVKWEFKKIALMLAVAVVLCVITTFFDSYDLVYRILIKGGILLTFPFLLYLFNFYEEIELETINIYQILNSKHKWQNLFINAREILKDFYLYWGF
ncbi:polysaccharide biosynthesis C-terminal domain-containing protein, partial [Calditrichota bacterium]